MTNICSECYWFEDNYCPNKKAKYDDDVCKALFYNPKTDHIKTSSPGF